MAKEAGITGQSPDDLRRFDELYFDFYPYLAGYVPDDVTGKRCSRSVSVSARSDSCSLRAVPTTTASTSQRARSRLMRRRLGSLGRPEDNAVQASVLDLPFEAGTFDYVYSIGCLHHTGDIARSVREVHRVLVPGGRAVVMLYNRHSLRRLAFGLARGSDGRGGGLDDEMRGLYDAHELGRARAPHRLRLPFATCGVSSTTSRASGSTSRTSTATRFGIKREWFLGNLARVLGLDLYIVADKRG